MVKMSEKMRENSKKSSMAFESSIRGGMSSASAMQTNANMLVTKLFEQFPNMSCPQSKKNEKLQHSKKRRTANDIMIEASYGGSLASPELDVNKYKLQFLRHSTHNLHK